MTEKKEAKFSQEQYDLLVKSSKEKNKCNLWNKWRKDNRDTKIELDGANLKGADLRGAHLEGAYLFGANLERANLDVAHLEGAVLFGTVLRGADLDGAHLDGAHLRGADLRGADLRGVHLEGANLEGANLRRANLRRASLEGTYVANINYNRRAHYREVRVATCYGSPRFKRFAQDQDFIEELRESSKWGKFVYYIWLIFADCGRSLWPWIFWSALFAVYFGVNFFWMGPESFQVEPMKWGLLPMIYYSVVTFTTLGFGDIVPRTSEAAIWVMIEVIIGYIMLGGLISIFSTKLARRS